MYKYLLIAIMLLIAWQLGKALFFLAKPNRDGVVDGDEHRAMLRALAWRIGLSIVLFLFLMVALYFGWTT